MRQLLYAEAPKVEQIIGMFKRFGNVSLTDRIFAFLFKKGKVEGLTEGGKILMSHTNKEGNTVLRTFDGIRPRKGPVDQHEIRYINEGETTHNMTETIVKSTLNIGNDSQSIFYTTFNRGNIYREVACPTYDAAGKMDMHSKTFMLNGKSNPFGAVKPSDWMPVQFGGYKARV